MKVSLLKQFSILSFLIISALGIILGYTYSEFFRSQILQVSAQRTADTVKILISYSLRPEDFSGKIAPERIAQLGTVFAENVLSDEIKGVVIWNKAGEIVFSNQQELIGRAVTPGPEVSEALKGRLAADFADFGRQNNYFTKLDFTKKYISINVPIQIAGTKGISGVYEVFVDAGHMQEDINLGQHLGYLFIAVSFVVLYFSLYQIVKKASKTIEHQDAALSSLTSRLDDTMKDQEISHVGTIKALMGALDAKDHYTAGHCSRVTDYAIMLGKKLGLTTEQLNILEEASLFHDIGKIGVPELILNKQENLNSDEFEVIKKHSAIGSDIIGSISSFKEHIKIVRYHHERWDGRGYPDQIKGEEIPIECRILSVADTYDAITSDRPYRSRMSKEKALTIIRECSGTQFDPYVARIFLDLAKEF